MLEANNVSILSVKMTSRERLEIRTNIEFCADLGKTPTDTRKLLQKTRGNVSVSHDVKNLKTMRAES